MTTKQTYTQADIKITLTEGDTFVIQTNTSMHTVSAKVIREMLMNKARWDHGERVQARAKANAGYTKANH